MACSCYRHRLLTREFSMALRPFTLYCASSTLRIRSWCVRMSSATPFRAMKLSMRLTLQRVRKSQRVGFTYSFQSLSLTSRARTTTSLKRTLRRSLVNVATCFSRLSSCSREYSKQHRHACPTASPPNLYAFTTLRRSVKRSTWHRLTR